MRNRQLIVRSFLLVAISAASLLPIYAQGQGSDVELDLTLIIDNPLQTVGPNENVVLNVTLTNELTSPEAFDGSGNVSQFIVNGTLLDITPDSGNPFNVDFGNTSDLFLNPGDSASFTFITLIPDPAPVAPGTYTSSGLGFNYGDDGMGGQFEVFSSPGIEITVIPEPTSAVLACLAIAAVASRRLR